MGKFVHLANKPLICHTQNTWCKINVFSMVHCPTIVQFHNERVIDFHQNVSFHLSAHSVPHYNNIHIWWINKTIRNVLINYCILNKSTHLLKRPFWALSLHTAGQHLDPLTSAQETPGNQDSSQVNSHIP